MSYSTSALNAGPENGHATQHQASCQTMPDNADELLFKRPPRLPSPEERQLLQEWLSQAGDITSAYLCERSSDDPAIYRRFVITAGPGDRPTHLVHSPMGMHLWLKMALGSETKVEVFSSLRSALHSIRPVLDTPQSPSPIKP